MYQIKFSESAEIVLKQWLNSEIFNQEYLNKFTLAQFPEIVELLTSEVICTAIDKGVFLTVHEAAVCS